MSDYDSERWHGTASGYTNHKCRCVQCKAAWASYIGRVKAVRKSKVLAADDPRHGTTNLYGNFSCRCEACTEAHRVATKHRRYRRREQRMLQEASKYSATAASLLGGER